MKHWRNQNPFDDFLEDLKTVGVQTVLEKGAQYAVIPARTNERWILTPLKNAKVANSGLAFLHPMNKSAKVGKWVLGSSITYQKRLLRRIRLTKFKDIADHFADPEVSTAYFTGTSGPHRKTTAQFMASTGQILGYAKITRQPKITKFVKNEARVLSDISTLGLQTVILPNVIAFHSDEQKTLLVTDTRKTARSQSPTTFTKAHRDFLQELYSRTESRSALALFNTIREIAQRNAPEWRDRLLAGLAVLEPFVNYLPTCRSHGDFTPWNCFLVDQKLYVFDWEYSHSAYPVGYDFVNFQIATNPKAPLNRIAFELAELLFAGAQKQANVALLASLLLHASFYSKRELDAQNPPDQWPKSTLRAALIDKAIGWFQ